MKERQYYMFIVCVVISGTVCQDCYDVPTSEGLFNLEEGMFACTPLKQGQKYEDRGRNYVRCARGKLVVMSCPPSLRYDTSVNSCYWPYHATCRLPENLRSSGRPVTSPRPVLTGPCNSGNCKLPDCFCFGNVPSAIPLAERPMFIMLTYAGKVTSSLYFHFRPIVVNNDNQLYNPNGCRMKLAVYASQSQDRSGYSSLKGFHETGNEVGSYIQDQMQSHGDQDGDYLRIADEIRGLKAKMLKATMNQTLVDSILGFRADYVAGDVQFDALSEFGFLYDTSIMNLNIRQGKFPVWPFTLDFVMRECLIPPCPTKSYPGLWEVPINSWIGDDNQSCSMIPDCNVGEDWLAGEQQWYNFYTRNFQRYFYKVKVPMPMYMNVNFSNSPYLFPALARWFRDVLKTHKDVWFVTPAQVIDWMKNPLTNSEMIAQKWGC